MAAVLSTGSVPRLESGLQGFSNLHFLRRREEHRCRKRSGVPAAARRSSPEEQNPPHDGVGQREEGYKLSRRSLIEWGTATFLGAGCSCCVGSAQAKEIIPWGYGYTDGPHTWNGMCAAGERQSPIPLKIFPDIDDIEAFVPHSQIQFNYVTEENALCVNTGHGTMQVNFPPGQGCIIGHRDLELVQYHFHAPSEHIVNGKRGCMEVHLVHKDRDTGGLAVLGALMKRSDVVNPALDAALRMAPEVGSDKKIRMDPFNPIDLLPKCDRRGRRPSVHYRGSLTTPPCSEKVEWFVFKDPVYVHHMQVLRFGDYLSDNIDMNQNSRPLQASKSVAYEFVDI